MKSEKQTIRVSKEHMKGAVDILHAYELEWNGVTCYGGEITGIDDGDAVIYTLQKNHRAPNFPGAVSI